jgi:hypothetical protein
MHTEHHEKITHERSTNNKKKKKEGNIATCKRSGEDNTLGLDMIKDVRAVAFSRHALERLNSLRYPTACGSRT